ncbi:ABC transporter permease [Suttonella sp. R2A3]|uniref:ABC transporter permease n=1 Tax=Suttonella sp. R2A3 TaxID=2908648 RepID=UPI001F251475|nr:ABC transporter permease [Suttonella sp. R2A3]UJF24352.1 ABC transporter permease [Suttonella sp. R2A3]
MQTHAFTTLLRKEIRRFTRLWTQTLLPSAVTSTLYFLIFGELIGQRIGSFEGFPYASFIAPGLIMMTVINNTYGNVVSSFYSARFSNSVEELLISPMPNAMILAGYVSAGVLRGIIVGALVTLVAMFFTDIYITHWWVTLCVLLLTAIAFSLGGFVNAIFARGFDDAAIVPTFVLTPLTYLGGVFYSITVLPEFWQGVSQLNPILYMVNGFRYGFLGISDVPLWQTIGFLITLCIGLTIWALHLMDSPGRLRK